MTAPRDPFRWLAAVHEAGHAIVGCEVGLRPLSLSIANDGSGIMKSDPADEVELPEGLAILAAGVEATRVFGLPAYTFMIADDRKQMILSLELNDYSSESESSKQLLDTAHKRARSILEAHRQQLEAVAAALYDTGYLDAHAFAQAMGSIDQ